MQSINPVPNALPTTVCVEIGGEQLSLCPFKTRELPTAAPLLAQLYGQADAWCREGSLSADVLLARLFSECRPQFTAVLRAATGKSQAWLDKLSVDDTLELSAVVYNLNLERYEKPAIGSSGGAASARARDLTFEEVVGDLLAAGVLSYTELLEMTPRQLAFFHDRAFARESRMRACFITDSTSCIGAVLSEDAGRSTEKHQTALLIHAGLLEDESLPCSKGE